MELMDVKSAHNHRDRHAQRNHDRAKRRAKPAEAAVQAHMVCANQRGLDDIKDYPRRECGSVEPEEQWPRLFPVASVGARSPPAHAPVAAPETRFSFRVPSPDLRSHCDQTLASI